MKLKITNKVTTIFMNVHPPNTKPQTPNKEHRTQNKEQRTPNTEQRTQNKKQRTFHHATNYLYFCKKFKQTTPLSAQKNVTERAKMRK